MISNVFILSGVRSVNDRSTNSYCTNAALRGINSALSSNQIKTALISAKDLSNYERWGEGKAVYVLPGGSAFLQSVMFNEHPDLKEKLQWSLCRGDGFIGFCAGANLAAKRWVAHQTTPGDNLFGNESLNVNTLCLMNVTATSPQYHGTLNNYKNMKNSGWKAPSIKLCNEHFKDPALSKVSTLWLGGPSFSIDDSSSTQVIAEYPEGDPAIVAKNNIVLSGVHPEIPADVVRTWDPSDSCRLTTQLFSTDNDREKLLKKLFQKAGISD